MENAPFTNVDLETDQLSVDVDQFENAITKVDRTVEHPLSLLQEELYALANRDPVNSNTNSCVAIRLKGEIDLEILKSTIKELIARHEVLRTNFQFRDGKPVQIINENTDIDLHVSDLSDMNQPEALVLEHLKKDHETSFDLEKDLLIRSALYTLNDHDCILSLCVHRLVCDRKSFKLIAAEITKLYDVILHKNTGTLRALPVQYIDFANWQLHNLTKSKLKEQREHWLKALVSAPPLDLKPDFWRPAGSNGNCGTYNFDIPEAVIQGVRKISARENVSTEDILMTTFGTLLHRYTGQDDLCFCWEMDGRKRSALLVNLIGPFANLVTLRLDFSGNPHFVEMLRRVQAAAETAAENSDIPFEKVYSEMSSGMPGNGAPLIQAVFGFERQMPVNARSKGIELTAMDVAAASCGVSIQMYLAEKDDGIEGCIQYRPDTFKSETIERISHHYTNLLKDIVQNPKREIGRLEMMSAEEKERVLGIWNETQLDYPKSITIVSMFEEQAEKAPDKIALIHGSRKITYRELNQRANQLAWRLKARGLSTGSLAAICVDQSFDLIIGILGIIKAGGAYVPLDPTYPRDRLAMILNDCRAPMLLTKRNSAVDLVEMVQGVVFMDEDKNEIESESTENPDNRITQDDIFYIVYTSGSTGKPKGVSGSYKGIVNRLFWIWETFPFTDNEVCCMKTSVAFIDHVAEVFGPLLKGIPLLLISHGDVANHTKLLEIIVEKKVTRVVLVPSLLQKILSLKREKVRQLSNLKYVFCSGEALPVRLAKQFYQGFPNARLVNIYGTTEVSADAAFYEVKRFHVDDVLKYFTKTLELPDSLIEIAQDRYPNFVAADRITEPNVSVDEVARRFTSTKIAEWPMTLEQYFKKLHSDVLPYVINTAAPTFIGHMTSALPDFVHDLSKLVSQLNQNLVKIETGKSLIFLEREALGILHRSFYDLPEKFYEAHVQQVNMNLGLVTTGGTTANIIALLAARNRALFGSEGITSGKSIYALLREKGYEDMTILGSKLMHYSMRKATSVLGMGIDSIMYVDYDENGKLDIDDLKRKIEECRRKRLLVLAIVGIAGATETGQIEPLAEMGELANSLGIYFHADAAWGGTTILSEKHKSKLEGIEKADSITFCGHKQLYLPQGISVCLFKDPTQAKYVATSASYQAAPDSYDVGRFTLEGSRSAISLCLHAALRIIGKKGYEMLVDSGIEAARFFAELIKSTEAFELIGYPQLNIVNYRYLPIEYRGKVVRRTLTDADNRTINRINTKIQEAQFLRAKTFASKTTLTQTTYGKGKDIVVLRVVLSNPLTTQADIYAVLEDQLMIARELFGEINDLSLSANGKTVVDEWQGGLQREPVFVDEHQEAFVPIGRPLANCMLYILDKYGNPTPVGIAGELYVGGAAVNQGYFQMPALTDKAFVTNPFTSDRSARMFKTGDRARFLEDGNIEYLGRFDDQVKIQGYRIEIAEVELALREIDGVENCVVLAKTNSEGHRCLVAYLELKKGGADLSTVRNSLAGKLPHYMIPSVFEVIEAIPLIPNGKTDKKALERMEILSSLAEV